MPIVPPSARSLVVAALLLPLLVAPGFVPHAAAQDYDRPPAGFGDDAPYDGGGRYGGGGRRGADDPGAESVRVGKLEGRIREMTGQIEELQNANRKLVEQVQRFQADVESRLQGRSGAAQPAKRSDASGLAGAPGEVDPLTSPAKLAEAKPQRRGDDAFDPAATPSAPGAPKPLGSPASATPPDSGDAPLDLSGGRRAASSSTLAPTLQLPSATTPKSTGATTPNAMVASLRPNSTREEFDAALGLYKEKQYETAEQGFSAFIQKNPKSRLVADATFYLGETYAQRGRSREAAEQYLKFSTDFTTSSRAPEAMLRLGSSLKAIGAKEQACASFAELPRKYPNAPAYVKSGAEREAKRAQC